MRTTEPTTIHTTVYFSTIVEPTTADLTWGVMLSTGDSQHFHDQETTTHSDYRPSVKQQDAAAIVSSNVFNRNFLVIVICAAVGGVFLVLIAFVVVILLVLMCIRRRKKQRGKQYGVDFDDENKTTSTSDQRFM